MQRHSARQTAGRDRHVCREAILHPLHQRISCKHFNLVLPLLHSLRNIPTVRRTNALSHILAVDEQPRRHADVFKFQLHMCRLVQRHAGTIAHFAGKFLFPVPTRHVEQLRLSAEGTEIHLSPRFA